MKFNLDEQEPLTWNYKKMIKHKLKGRIKIHQSKDQTEHGGSFTLTQSIG